MFRNFFSGGFNLEGHPIVSFPPECTPDFEQYSAGDLLHLLQYYVRIAGLKISVLLNMREKWTESGITKVITVFDELQVSVNLITWILAWCKRIMNSKKNEPWDQWTHAQCWKTAKVSGPRLAPRPWCNVLTPYISWFKFMYSQSLILGFWHKDIS